MAKITCLQHVLTHLPCQWTGSALVQVMACRLLGAKPLPEAILVYCQFDSWEQVSVKLESEFLSSSFKKMHLKMLSAKMAAILSRGDDLKKGIHYITPVLLDNHVPRPRVHSFVCKGQTFVEIPCPDSTEAVIRLGSRLEGLPPFRVRALEPMQKICITKVHPGESFHE